MKHTTFNLPQYHHLLLSSKKLTDCVSNTALFLVAFLLRFLAEKCFT